MRPLLLRAVSRLRRALRNFAACLLRHRALRCTLRWLQHQSPITAAALVLLSILTFLAAWAAPFYLRPLPLAMAISVGCYLISKLTRYAAFAILGTKGTARLKTYLRHRKKRKQHANTAKEVGNNLEH